MGTMLYAKGIPLERSFDELNLSKPELVRSVHEGYVAAGAEVIETNTFGANRIRLHPFGLEDQVRRINLRGAEIAREVAAKAPHRVFVAGSVGPLGTPLRRSHPVDPSLMEEIFGEQIQALLDGGVDLLILETFSHLDELATAVRVARRLTSAPIVAQMSFLEEGTTIDGDRPEEVPRVLLEAGADVVGANCSFGPQPMLETMERMATGAGEAWLSAQPNAGIPQMVEGRWIYVTSPEYMANHARRFIEDLGVRLVGGCCGTNPDHVRAMANLLRALHPRRAAVSVRPSPAPEGEEARPVPLAERSRLAAKLARGGFCTSVELNPPRGVSPERFLRAARALKEAGVDAVNIPDGARATARISPLAMALLLQREVGLEPILHYCCRDRNLLGMQSDLLGAHVLGIRNLIIITGDPPKLGDYPQATAVFDVDSVGLVGIVQGMNRGRDLAGRTLGGQTAFFVAVGANPGALNLEEEIRHLRDKVAAGAEAVFTQPVFHPGTLERFLAATEEIPLPVFVGLLPLTSFRNAEFLHNEVPGMSIPEAVRERMRSARDAQEARRIGIAVAREVLTWARQSPRIRGAYVMPPFGRYELALEVLEPVLRPDA
jgi:homocysteine S-methyltransferase